MSLPTPPRYVVLPQDVIDQAYAPEKPRRALLASFARILSLAWEAKYQHTPSLNVEELIEFLKLSRRQYFEQIADMELLQWLRSSHPVPGFVRFTFSRSISDTVAAQDLSAENRTDGAENRTTELKRMEEESLKVKNQESSSSFLKQNAVRKTAPAADVVATYPEWIEKLKLLIEHLPILFDPEIYGVLEMRDEFLAAIPERALGWIAKAYQDRARFTNTNGAIGLIVNHLVKRDAPRPYYTSNYEKILPEAYLEAVGAVEYSCDHCDQAFDRRALLDEHTRSCHHICMECGKAFDTEDLEKAHYDAEHKPYRAKPAALPVIQAPALDGTTETLWTNVLSQLQQEMPRASFDTWVRDTEPVRYDGNVLEIATRNNYAQDWLTSRVTGTVERLLANIAGKTIKVCFVVETNSSLIEVGES